MKSPTIKAYCWRTGLIGFGKRKPKGTLLLIEGPERRIRKLIGVTARHSYNGKLLVPGVPEAELLKKDPVQCVIDFVDWIKTRTKKP